MVLLLRVSDLLQVLGRKAQEIACPRLVDLLDALEAQGREERLFGETRGG